MHKNKIIENTKNKGDDKMNENIKNRKEEKNNNMEIRRYLEEEDRYVCCDCAIDI